MKYIAIAITIGIVVFIGVGYAILSSPQNTQKTISTGESTTNRTGKNVTENTTTPSKPESTRPPAKVVKVEELAVTKQSLSLTNCEAKPAVLKAKQGSRVSITNNDAVDRTIANGTFKLLIKSKSTSDLSITQLGSLAYTCDADKRGAEPVMVIIGER